MNLKIFFESLSYIFVFPLYERSSAFASFLRIFMAFRIGVLNREDSKSTWFLNPPFVKPPLSAQIRNCICHLGLVQGGVSRTLEFSFFSHNHVTENHHMTWQYHVISVYDPYDRHHVIEYHVSVSSPLFWAVLIL